MSSALNRDDPIRRVSVISTGPVPAGLLMGPHYRMASFEMTEDQPLSALLESIGSRAGGEASPELLVLATHDPGAATELAAAMAG